MGRKPNTTCSTCGAALYRRPSTQQRTSQAFCSRKCQGAPRKAKRKKVVCPCGEVLSVPAHKTTKFCSRSCAGRARQGMKYTGDKKGNAQIRRFVALARSAGFVRCMIKGCASARTLDLHRLVEGKDGGTYTPGNVFMLCPNHHAEFHRGIITLEKTGTYELTAHDTGKENQWSMYGI